MSKSINIFCFFLAVFLLALSLGAPSEITPYHLDEVRYAVVALGGLVLLWLAFTINVQISLIDLIKRLIIKSDSYQPMNAYIGLAIILIALNFEIIQKGFVKLDSWKLIWVTLGLLVIISGRFKIQHRFISTIKDIWLDPIIPPDNSYRPEVDGLRAIAVLAVLAYHFDMPFIDGGFVGVDVFFVISGYLITGIILRDLTKGSFSLAHFYERRVRRIFPALAGLLIGVLLFGQFFYDPLSFKSLAESAYATTFFSSNFLFFKQVDYFDAPAELKPLLHTWSLAVEEQFYVFFPLVMLAVWTWARKHLKTSLIVLTAASFVWSVFTVPSNPSTAFYMFHLRAWELLLGSLIALGMVPRISNSQVRAALSWLGLGLIVISAFTYSPNTEFPGVSALLPTFGAYLFISMEGKGRTIAGRLLSIPPATFIGKISYSLYLWHWPILLFANYLNVIPLSQLQIGWVAAGSLIVATLSWWLIETPFRKAAFWSQSNIFKFGLAYLLIIGLGSAVILKSNGIPQRFPWFSSEIVDTLVPDSQIKKCFSEFIGTTDFNGVKSRLPYIEHLCEVGESTVEPSFAIIGDSHAHALLSGIELAAQKNGVSGVVIIHWACPPLNGVSFDLRPDCDNYTDINLKYLIENEQIETVFIAAHWFGNTSNADRILSMEDIPSKTTKLNDKIFKIGLEETVLLLNRAGKQVVIIEDVPRSLEEVPAAFFVARRSGSDILEKISYSKEDLAEFQQIENEILHEVSAGIPGTVILDPKPYFLVDGKYPVVKDDYPLFKDTGHLNWWGSLQAAPMFNNFFKKQAAASTR